MDATLDNSVTTLSAEGVSMPRIDSILVERLLNHYNPFWALGMKKNTVLLVHQKTGGGWRL